MGFVSLASAAPWLNNLGAVKSVAKPGGKSPWISPLVGRLKKTSFGWS
jgi:hypothetical protein